MPRFTALGVVISLVIFSVGWLVYKWSQQGMPSIDLVKMMYGFLVLVLITALAVMSMRMTEESRSDPELSQILTMLSVLAGGFAQWAFSSGSKPPDQPK